MDNEENYNEIYQKGRKWLINIENYDKFIYFYLWNHYEDYYQIWNYFHEKVKIIRLPNWHLRSAKFLIIFVHWDLISKPFLGLRPALPLLELARTPSSPRDNLELIRPTSVAPILTTTVRWIDDTSNALIEMWAPFIISVYVEFGASATDSITLTNTWASTTSGKSYNILTRQIACDASWK